jgi:putative membrane protein
MALTQPRRVHPLTIAINSLRAVPIVAVGWLLLTEGEARRGAPWLLGGLAVFAVVVVLASWLRWRRLSFCFDTDGDFRLDSGVLFRQERRVALSRLQSVDVVRPLVARLFGMAAVRIEVAGGREASAVVEFLPDDQAASLRAEVLARAAGVASDAPAAPEELLVQVPFGELVASLLLRGSTALAIVITVAAATGVLLLTGPAGFLVVGFGVFVPLATVIGEFTSFYGFTVSKSADGIRIRSGLLSTTAQTVPHERVHAVELTQPLLWRGKDWVRVSMNIAGSGPVGSEGGKAVPKVLIPVATRTQALQLLQLLLPGWSLDDRDFAAAPSQAARRAWIQHRALGVSVDEQVLVVRRGRLVRRTGAVAHARVQSVRLVQGPWQRALGLATVAAETVPGPVRLLALHRAAGEARQLAEDEIERMHRAGLADAPARWRSRPLQGLDEPQPAAPGTQTTGGAA